MVAQPRYPQPKPPPTARDTPMRLVGVWRPYTLKNTALRPICTAAQNRYGGYIVNPLGEYVGWVAPTMPIEVIGPLNTWWPDFGIPLGVAHRFRAPAPPVGELKEPEPLYVSIVGPAALEENDHTVKILPGGVFNVPAGCAVWVSADTDGHAFSAVFGQDAPQKATAVPSTGWPPNGVTGLTFVMYAYLYQEYSDDDDLQEFVKVLNSMQQDYVDTFNAIELPIYPNPLIKAALADWAMTGIYGYPRPVFYTAKPKTVGPLNTYWADPVLGWTSASGTVGLPLNAMRHVEPPGALVSDDDLYKRALTWHFQKGDGKYFNIRWLKRRIMRFLIGPNGTCPHIDNTDRISIQFGPDGASIRIINSVMTVKAGAIPNMFGANGLIPGAIPTTPGGARTITRTIGPLDTMSANFDLPLSKAETIDIFEPGAPAKAQIADVPPDSLLADFTTYPLFDHAAIFQEAVWAGVLELPFQFAWDVVIG